MAYSAMMLLPYSDESFSCYQPANAQETCFGIGQQIQDSIIFSSFVDKLETVTKSCSLIKIIEGYVLSGFKNMVLVNKCVGATYKSWYFGVHNRRKCTYQHRCWLTPKIFKSCKLVTTLVKFQICSFIVDNQQSHSCILFILLFRCQRISAL